MAEGLSFSCCSVRLLNSVTCRSIAKVANDCKGSEVRVRRIEKLTFTVASR